MGQKNRAETPDQGATETVNEMRIDKSVGSHPLARELPHFFDALPYLIFGFCTLSIILTPRILIENPNHIGTFNFCGLFGANLCGSWLWSGWLYVLTFLAFVIFLRENRRRRNAEAKLRIVESEAASVEFSQLGIWSWDPATDRVQVNDAGRRLLFIRPGVPIGLSDFVQVFCAEDRLRLQTYFADTVKIGTRFTTAVRIVGTSRVVRWIQIGGKFVEDADSTGGGKCTGILIDVSVQRNLAEAAEIQRERGHSVEMEILGGLSGVIAHELKQPLTAILSNAQAAELMLKRSPLNVAELQQTIRDIIEDDSRAGALILQLRSLIKNDEKDWTILELSQVIGDVLRIANGILAQGNIQLELKLSDESICVRGNRIQLQLLILNLILNATEAMSKNVVPRKLIVETVNDRTGMAVISVTDSGPGIPKEIRSRLFDPFFTTKTQGMGIGLSICRLIAATHGGHLSALNGKDRGATFFVALPAISQGTVCPKIRVRLSS